MKTCQLCGKEINTASRARKYCSDECRKHVKYEKDRAWLKAHPGKAAEYGRNWYKNNRELCLEAKQDIYRKKVYETI